MKDRLVELLSSGGPLKITHLNLNEDLFDPEELPQSPLRIK